MFFGGELNHYEARKMHIVIIWQRFLPYHVACIRHTKKRLAELGHRLTAIEVAAQDASYGFPKEVSDPSFDYVCCFPKTSYHEHRPREIFKRVFSALRELSPDIVFSPATAFPEGMAAYNYRLRHGKRSVMMDDMWEYADRRGGLVREVKRLINRNIEGVFIPAPSHLHYYKKMGFPEERIVFGVYSVDNDFFSNGAAYAQAHETVLRRQFDLPVDYFLFVGRFLARKGIETLIEAFRRYRCGMSMPWDLLLVGSGDQLTTLQSRASDIEGIRFVGPKFGDTLCHHYGLAKALIVPSLIDQWGLVINEGMASGLPVIVSRGCGGAKTLVREGENGWTFDPGNVETLAGLMSRMSKLSREDLISMAEQSKQIISEWSLDRFSDGVLKALTIPRRPPEGFFSNLATRLWKGRVRTR